MPNLALFKQMNRLANQGRWNFVTQRPRKLLFGAEAKEPYELYAKMVRFFYTLKRDNQ